MNIAHLLPKGRKGAFPVLYGLGSLDALGVGPWDGAQGESIMREIYREKCPLKGKLPFRSLYSIWPAWGTAGARSFLLAQLL